mgnify:FL=1
MALKVSKALVLAAEIQDQPGGLAGALAPLAQAGANLEFLIARRRADMPGRGVVFIPQPKGKKAHDAAKAAGFNPTATIPTLRVEGADKPGLGYQIMRAIADAGVSMRGASAAVIGKNFVAYIGFDTTEGADAAAKAVRAIKVGGAKPKSKRRGR